MKIKQQLAEGKKLLQFSFLKATGQGLAMVVPLVVAKFFSTELFGSYSLAKMVVFFFTSLLIASAQTPFIVFANQEKAKTGKINKSFSVQCLFLVLSTATFIGLNFIFSKPIMTFAQIKPTHLVFMSLAFIGIAVKFFLNNLFMALAQRVKSALAELAFGSISLIFLFIFYFIGWINLSAVFLIYFIAGVSVVLIFIKTIDFSQLRPFSFDKGHLKKMFNFTKWIMLGGTSAYFINWGDNLVLRPFVPIGDIGSYNFAYQIFKGTVMLTYIVSVYFLPFISQHIEDKNKIKNYLFIKRPIIFIPGICVIILIYILIPHILQLIYGSTYMNSVVVVRILLIASILTLYNSFYIPILEASKRYKFTQTTIVMQVLLNVLLNLIFIPRIGMRGAAVATLLAYLCRTVAIELYYRFSLKKLLQI